MPLDMRPAMSIHTKPEEKKNWEAQVAAPPYQGHKIFQDLSKYIDFYNSWAFSTFFFMTQGTTSVVNLDSYVFSSIKGTLSSINMILKDGRINDSWTLLRKYHDSIIINIYSCLFLKDNFSINNFVVKKINDWIHGKSSLPEFRIMSQYIRNHGELSELNKLIYETDDRYKKIRDRCNDNTHYNFFKNMLLNDNEIYLKNRILYIDRLRVDLRDLFILHVSYIFFLREWYMASSDYVDYLECGDTPPEDSQYWVAPFIQEIFNNCISNFRPDIANYLKKNLSMHLE